MNSARSRPLGRVPRFAGEEMIVMFHMSRIRTVILVIALVLALAPMANALPLNAAPVDRSESGWLDTAVRWVEEAGLKRPGARRPGHSGSQTGVRKEANSSTGGSCIDPQGNPRPWSWCV
jgi:hypothetical protein